MGECQTLELVGQLIAGIGTPAFPCGLRRTLNALAPIDSFVVLTYHIEKIILTSCTTNFMPKSAAYFTIVTSTVLISLAPSIRPPSTAQSHSSAPSPKSRPMISFAASIGETTTHLLESSTRSVIWCLPEPETPC